MSDAIAPKKTVTFTITGVPTREASIKTLQRLMRMQPRIQRGLKKLAKRRDRKDNIDHPRGGRLWTSRVRATKLVNVSKGESFTLTLTPQIIADVRSVEKYLDARVAS
jgi:hypothetical protein